MSSITEPILSGSSVEFFRERFIPLSIFLGCINNIMYGFLEWLHDEREHKLIKKIKHLSPVEQIKWDIALNDKGKDKFPHFADLYANDNAWKQTLIAIFQGEETRNAVIQQTKQILERDIQSHMQQEPSVATGSSLWHTDWVEIYRNWVTKLEGILSRSLNVKEG